MSLFFDRHLRALNSDVTFSGGSQSLEKFWYEVSAVSSSLVLITDIYPCYINPHILCRRRIT